MCTDAEFLVSSLTFNLARASGVRFFVLFCERDETRIEGNIFRHICIFYIFADLYMRYSNFTEKICMFPKEAYDGWHYNAIKSCFIIA